MKGCVRGVHAGLKSRDNIATYGRRKPEEDHWEVTYDLLPTYENTVS